MTSQEWTIQVSGMCLTLIDPEGMKHYGQLESWPNFIADGGQLRGRILWMEDSVQGIAELISA
jgi:hypothetical protein